MGKKYFFFSLAIFEREKAEELRAGRERQLDIDLQFSGDVSATVHKNL